MKFQHFPLKSSCKSIAIAGFILFLFFFLLFFFFFPFLFSHLENNQTSDYNFIPFQLKWPDASPPCSNVISTNNNIVSPTNMSHIGFIVVGSLTTWKHRQTYTQSWWRPNVTRGYVFLDKEPTQEFLPWPSISPPFQINDDITKLRSYSKFANPIQIRMFRSILDMYKVGDKGLRWFIMCDDDTVFLVDNLVEVLRNYDHSKYYYIGTNSESVKSNADFSFDMGFGGAGYAISYAFVKVLVTKLDACIERYPYLVVSDHLAQSCFADLGVSLTIEKGIHQIDLVGDISGFLSSHPQSPFLTLHHFDVIDSIFPSMDSHQSVHHLMKPAKFDQSRLLQQTICFQRQFNLSFSLSWGYSAHMYESIIPRSILRKPLETFRPWSNHANPPFFMFNTRSVTSDPCEAPHVFFFDTVASDTSSGDVVTTYVRSSPRNLPPCLASGNHSVDHVSMIRVLSSTIRKTAGVIECCDVDYKVDRNVTEMKIRSCMTDEVIA